MQNNQFQPDAIQLFFTDTAADLTLLLGAAHASFMPPHMRGLLLLALIAECRNMVQDPQPDLDDHHDIDNVPGLN